MKVRFLTSAVMAGSLSLGLPGAASIRTVRAEPVFPGAVWATRTPAEAGMDAVKLDQIAAAIGGNGCIVRDGYMVRTWGSQSAKGDWASASKPVLSTLLFFAIEEGRLTGVDALVRDSGWSLNAKDQPMTFRHLANMTGNYTRGEAPGTAWAYNDYNIQLYVRTLFDRVYGQPADTVALSPARLGTLQFQDGSLFPATNRITTSVRDFARIGWLWANKGKWNGAQLLPQHYFDDYMKPHVPASLPKTTSVDPGGDYLAIGTYGGGSDQTPYGPGIYGFNWWFNATGGLHPTSTTWPDAPADTFQANGHWGREVVTVMPGLRIVMAYFGGATLGFVPGSAASSSNQVLKLLAESVAPTTPLISLNKSQIARTVHFGEAASPDTFTVANTGVGTLQYTVSSNRSWLAVAPSGGDSTGEADVITVSYTAAGLGVGVHAATVTVTDNGSVPAASNSPQSLSVSLTIKTVVADFDRDGDVDMEDFGYLQRCFSGTDGARPPGCDSADITGEGPIDQLDLNAFLGCLSGADVVANKTCDDAFE